METKNLPAILPTTLTDQWGLSPINWMDPRLRGTDAYYPYTLLSAYHWIDYKSDFRDDIWIFGDSGGFSILTLGAQIDPRQVMRWQINNCDVGCFLDVPPHGINEAESHRGYAATHFDANLERSALNLKSALPIYLKARETGTKFRFWGVLHGQYEEQLNTWWDTIHSIYPFDDEGEGWAVKPLPSKNPKPVARLIRFLETKGVKRAHFLACTGPGVMATIMVMCREAGLDFVTFDSAAASWAGINRTLYLLRDDGFTWSLYSEKTRDGETHVRDFMLQRCSCASCEMMRTDWDTLSPQERETSRIQEYVKYRMIFHNQLIALSGTEAIRRASVEDPDYLLRTILPGRLYWDTLRAREGQDPMDDIPTGKGLKLLEGL